MGTIKEEAQGYEPKQTKNIADLPEVSVNLIIEDDVRTGTDKDGKVFEYKVTLINDEEYRVPDSVLKALKVHLEQKPDLEKFKVVKSGEGLNTTYTVVPL